MRGIGDALAFADAKLRGNKPLVMEAQGIERVDVKNIEAEHDLQVEVSVDDPMIYIYILSLIFCMIDVWENSTFIMIIFPYLYIV